MISRFEKEKSLKQKPKQINLKVSVKVIPFSHDDNEYFLYSLV